jgi:hypothetical protein
MASPTDIAVNVAEMATKAALDKVHDQSLITALLIIILTAAISAVIAWFGYKFLMKLVEAFKDISTQVGTLNLTLAKIVEVQSSDHSATVKNQEILLSQGTGLARIETCLGILYPELREHAKECREKDKADSKSTQRGT